MSYIPLNLSLVELLIGIVVFNLILVDSFAELRRLFHGSTHLLKLIAYTSADELYTIRQKSDESLSEYIGRFCHKYSRCAEADDKTSLRAFTVGIRECFFKYMINVNTWKT